MGFIHKVSELGQKPAIQSIKTKPINKIDDDYRKLTYKARKDLKGH